jgi:hypothetical protein
VAALLTLVMGGASGGCNRDARPIRNEFQALFDGPPVVTVVPCPDGDHAAGPSTQQCLRGDGSDRSALTATLASGYLDKAAALLGRGDATAGWRQALDALALYAKPKPYALRYFVSAGDVLDRVRELLARFPAPPAAMEQLRTAAADAFMPRPDFCAGLKLHMLFEIYRGFHDALAPLRPRVTERWGKPIVDALASGDRGDMALWRATRTFYDQLLDGCNHSSVPLLLRLDYDARPQLSAFPPGSSAKTQAELSLKWLRDYSDATDAFLVFFIDVARLTQLAAGKPADADTLTKLVLVPSLPMPQQSQWDGSMPELLDAGTPLGGLIVKRGALQRTLAPPAAAPAAGRRR